MPVRRDGAATQRGWVVLTVQCAHGLLHPDPARPPSPYAVVAVGDQAGRNLASWPPPPVHLVCHAASVDVVQ